MPARHLLNSLILSTVALFLTSTGYATDTPGLASKKPAEGPCVEVEGGYMVPYSVTLPGSEVTFEMIPIAGGTFAMGTAADNPYHQPSEGPPVQVRVAPFWIAKCEVTWAEYKQYMGLYQFFKKFQSAQMRPITDANRIDAITAPTELYEPSFTFEYGDDPQQAAVTMTQLGAKHYSQWISAVTGQQYRLPSEAEWEYACRAGTTTPWSFGDDPAKLGDYAWYSENSHDDGQHAVGQKQPNPWGLHDMHGNVAEWVLDEYTDEGFARLAGKTSLNALDTILWPDELYPRMVKGGSWESDAAGCRSASKMGSDDSAWKDNDPNLPKSPWWFTDDPARGVGFRLIRPLKEVSKAEMVKFWNIDCEDMRIDVKYRLEEGRGVLGIVDRDLPQAIETLKAME
ncbi:MAG: formylglycine-generating enzyme family protein [Planctomycetaceae bacterium]